MPDSPGRMVRMSAVGSTWDALIPKARRRDGAATYTCPENWRPAAACWSVTLVESSGMTSWEPRAEAMPRAVAAWDCGVLVVAGALGPLGPLPGPLPLLGVWTMSWFD